MQDTALLSRLMENNPLADYLASEHFSFVIASQPAGCAAIRTPEEDGFPRRCAHRLGMTWSAL
jgi:hypothetical protein